MLKCLHKGDTMNRFNIALHKPDTIPVEPAPPPLTEQERILKDYLPDPTTRTFQVRNQFIVLVGHRSYSVIEVIEVMNQVAYPAGTSEVLVRTPSYFYRIPFGGSGHFPHAADVVPGIHSTEGPGAVYNASASQHRLGSSYNEAMRRLQQIDREENPESYSIEERAPAADPATHPGFPWHLPERSGQIEPPTPCRCSGWYNPHLGNIKEGDYIWTHLAGWRIRGPVHQFSDQIPVRAWEQNHGRNSVIRSVQNTFWRRVLCQTILRHIPRPYPLSPRIQPSPGLAMRDLYP